MKVKLCDISSNTRRMEKAASDKPRGAPSEQKVSSSMGATIQGAGGGEHNLLIPLITQEQTAGRKRSFDEAEGEYPSPGEFSQMSRSERKRHREKRRRGQVNSGFDDLKDLLVRIDPEINEREEINRVDLIGRAVIVMKQLHDENERLKRQIPADGESDQVTVAMPFLVPRDHYPPAPQIHPHLSHPPPHHHFYGGGYQR